jgi:hypothetical protein
MQVQKDDAASCGRCYLYASRRVADVTASHRPCERGACRRSCIDSASMCRCGSAFALAAELAEVAVARVARPHVRHRDRERVHTAVQQKLMLLREVPSPALSNTLLAP